MNPGAAIHLECLDEKGRFVGGRTTPRVRGTRDWMEVSVITHPIVATARSFRVSPLVDGCPSGKAVFDNLYIEEVSEALLTAVATSAYRNEASDGRVTFFGGLDLVGNGLTRETASFKVSYPATDGTRHEKTGCILSDTEASADVDVADIAFGTNAVVCTVAGGGKSVSLSARFVRLRTPRKRRTYVASDGTLIDNGKPFFPVGIFARYLQDVDDFTKGGFNTVLFCHGCTNNAALDLCVQKGVRVIYNLFPYTRNEPMDLSGLRQTVRMFKDHPAVLAWYVNDELPKSRVAELRTVQRIIEDEDPDHPTYSCMNVPSDARAYLGTCDVYGFDPYPIRRGGEPTGEVRRSIRVGRAGTFSTFPVWQVPQAFAWEGCQLPTKDEMRQMTLQSVAAGAKGIVYFRYMHTNERRDYNARKDVSKLDFARNHAELEDIAKEVCKNASLFLSPVCDVKVEGSAPDLMWRAWRNRTTGAVRMLFVNNADGDQLVTELRVTPPGGRSQTVRLNLPPLGCEYRTLDVEHPVGDIVPDACVGVWWPLWQLSDRSK